MRRKKRTEISLAIDQVLVIKRKGAPKVGWCDQCSRFVSTVTPEEAALISSTRLRDIFRRLEAGCVHFTESPDGAVSICVNSLLI